MFSKAHHQKPGQLLIPTILKFPLQTYAVCKTPVEDSLNKQESKNWSGHVGQIKKEKKPLSSGLR